MDCGGLAVTVSAAEQESFTECIFSYYHLLFTHAVHSLCKLVKGFAMFTFLCFPPSNLLSKRGQCSVCINVNRAATPLLDSEVICKGPDPLL